MKQITTLLFIILLFTIDGFSQTNKDTIIDPIFPYCYKLKENQTIDTLKLEGKYIGKVILNAKCDTGRNTLKDFKIVFAKLKSIENSYDTIEIRQENKTGNYQFIEKYKDRIIEHVSFLKIEPTGIEGCKEIQFGIVVMISPKN